ncbi:MAG TPA: enoyl-CoA hydratase/isomerase family protein [Tepidiformaceae bacterium]|nr:enoyl-CoA hydratase/isomerase family protein [Tepidiformaceae bacterium]
MTAPGQIEIPPPSLDDVLYEKRDVYALITLNRPVVLNAINWSIQRRLWWALGQAEADDAVKVVVLTGAGRAFSAGGDIQSTPPTDNDPIPSSWEINFKIREMPKPVIAAVKGHAVGQGHELAGMCDLTIAAEDAKFGELQIRHGLMPPILITPYLVGPKQAKEILMLGEIIEAHDALRLGLVNRVVPTDRLLDEADAMARKLASLNQKSVRTNKLLVNRAYDLAGFRQGMEYREDPWFKAWNEGDEGMSNEHLRILREKGWEAFRDARDVNYGRGSSSSS